MHARFARSAVIALMLGGGVEVLADPATAISATEVEVLSALINHGLEPATSMLVIAEQTTGDPAGIARDPATATGLVQQLDIPSTTIADWVRTNERVELIDRPLALAVSYQVLSAKTLAELFKGVEPATGWQAFFARYRGAPGVLRVSHVGFDDSLNHALVYVEHECGAECGTGHLFHLTRAPAGGWTVAGGAVVWMVK